ncbi:hypothetical protein DERF_001959 [Dermatophagoides farinae]|uniref:Uncharacterized protein n=1 Tax=Dermatophagoides farinae TaxID=6954 RepID=A0A922L9Z3_DERFA|nr:hypothetical protein DERF_001959 [Dermatophagoides farinae]
MPGQWIVILAMVHLDHVHPEIVVVVDLVDYYWHLDYWRPLLIMKLNPNIESVMWRNKEREMLKKLNSK